MAKSKTGSVNRRGFLKSAGVTAAALVANPAPRASAATEASQEPARNATAPVVTRDAETGRAPITEAIGTDRPGSDFMVDVFKSMDFEFLCSNPANSFRSLHESIINYGGNKSPEFITCNHEEIAVAMAHGYAKIEGKPALVAVHGTVGLQHASMAIYDAFCDRVPVYIVLGNILDASRRRGVVDWAHSVQDATAMVREFVKWDDVPMSLPHFAESAARAYKIAMTPPMMPVALVLDKDLQERPITETLRLPKLTTAMPPQGDQGSVNEAARMLVAAESPVIVAGRLARTPAGLAHLIELAEALQAPVIDQKERMNFPTHHTLNHTERTRPILADADVILGLEVTDFSGMRSNRPAAKRISITANDLYTKNNYQDVQRYAEVDLAMAADAEATLPALVEAVRRLTTADRKRYFQDRGSKLTTSFQQAQQTMREAATYGWDASPISTARVSAELWQQIKTEDWSLVADVIFFSNWPLRLWKMDKHYHYIGGPGGFGVGYGLPAAVGAAAANKKHGRLTVNIQNDGDFMFAPGSLWTAAHHRIPLLTIMHNNRAYHQEVMEVQRIALQHNRGITHADIGNTLINPEIDYAKMAQSMGVHGEGPISNPKDLGPAIKRAIEVVKRGEPALVDVLTQPR
jgi:acetolactate synthase-1/2/3 large subunit